MSVIRCPWAKSEMMIEYHDREWGVPVHDERTLFEFLILEGAQAGLSWDTILRKRAAYRHAFDNFDAERVAEYGERKTAALLADAGIVRNRAKIAAAIGNAQALRSLRADFGSFDAYLWDFVGGAPVQRRRRTQADVPAVTPLAEKLSADLRARAFRFVGPTIVYSFMQAVGLVNDHLTRCFRYKELSG